MKRFTLAACSVIVFLTTSLFGQSNPVPFLNQPLVPSAVVPGGPAFTLTVNGTGFVSGAVVNWNGSPRSTTFVSTSQLSAAISASDIIAPATGDISVVNPLPGGGRSNVVFLPISTSTVSVGTNETDITVGPYGISIQEGDFNNDGRPDLAILSQCGDAACLTNGLVTILLGKGDGTFTFAPTVGTGFWATAMAVGDFNGDGNLDIAVASGNTITPATLSIFLGNGDGTFTVGATLTGTSGDSNFIAVGDFNGDGALDLAVDRDCFSPTGCNGNPSILLGNGDGTFRYASSAPGPGVVTMSVGDVNRDGKLDLVIDAGTGIFILLANGDGTFSAGASLDQGLNDRVAALGDFNGDGKLDMADFVRCTATPCVSGEASILLGNGDGTFTNTSTVATGPFTWFGLVGEFNGDGKLDLVGVSGCTELSCNNGEATFELGNGDGTFNRVSAFPAGPDITTTQGAVMADFNGDGRLDVATLSACGDGNCNSANGIVSILLQAPVVALSAANLSFGEQVIGTTSNARTVTLTNIGSVILNIANIVSSGDFAQTNTCGKSLAAQASCTISVTFTPSAENKRTGMITITDSASPGSQTISLAGEGTVVSLSTNQLNFGVQKVGTTSMPLSITVSNEGRISLDFTGIHISGIDAGDFTQRNNCGSGIAAGHSCTIAVTFTPGAKQGRFAVMDITDSGGGSPQSVTLRGTGN
jgi:FG-GAP-like repeat/Abnormal spindle-like microcephaly-assoc'd, ASPM-SPD-2-Hydin